MTHDVRFGFGQTVNMVGTLMAACAALFIGACSSDDQSKVVTPVKQIKREKAPDDPTAKMAHAVFVGNSNVPVDLKYEILNRPVVGEAVEVELALVPTAGADSMTVGFAASPGLTLSADSAPNIDTVKQGQIERVKFTALAKEDAVFYVTVTATMYTAGTSSPRSFAIPIIFGPPASAAAEPATDTVKTTEPAKKS